MSAGNYQQQRPSGGYGGLIVIALAVWLLFFGGLSTLQGVAPGVISTIQTGAGRVGAPVLPPVSGRAPVVVSPPVVSAPQAQPTALPVPDGYTRQADGTLVRSDAAAAPAAVNTAPEIPTAVVSVPTAIPASAPESAAAVAASVAQHADGVAVNLAECGDACTLPATAAPTAAPPPAPAPVVLPGDVVITNDVTTATGRWPQCMTVKKDDGSWVRACALKPYTESELQSYPAWLRSGGMLGEPVPAP